MMKFQSTSGQSMSEFMIVLVALLTVGLALAFFMASPRGAILAVQFNAGEKIANDGN